jgi:hypothetical protein
VRNLPSGKYQARFQDDGGVYHSAPRTFETKADAKAWLDVQVDDGALGS